MRRRRYTDGECRLRGGSPLMNPGYVGPADPTRRRASSRHPARRGAGSEPLEHPGVAERVRLDVREVEELGDTLVGAADELGVHVGVDDLLADLLESAPREELDLEREAEQPGEPERPRVRLERRRRSRGRPRGGAIRRRRSGCAPRRGPPTSRGGRRSRSAARSRLRRRRTAARPRTARRGPCRAGSCAARTAPAGRGCRGHRSTAPRAP